MGTQDGTSERLAPEDEQLFPHLTPENYRVTSPCDALYNCIAYAADDHALVWDPGMQRCQDIFGRMVQTVVEVRTR
jgi:hypothetical protein